MNIKTTPEADDRHCWEYETGARPKWTYDAQRQALWCDECYKGQDARCGISIALRWPEGFERPMKAQIEGLPLFQRMQPAIAQNKPSATIGEGGASIDPAPATATDNVGAGMRHPAGVGSTHCGHSPKSIVSSDKGTNWCRECEAEAEGC